MIRRSLKRMPHRNPAKYPVSENCFSDRLGVLRSNCIFGLKARTLAGHAPPKKPHLDHAMRLSEERLSDIVDESGD